MFDRIRRWEPWLLDYIPQPPKDSKRMALDIGAAHGDYAMDLSEVYDLVWAFEPDPRTYIALERMTRYTDNIKAHEAAVGASFGAKSLTLKKDPEKSSFKTGLDAVTSPDDTRTLVHVNTLDLLRFPVRVGFVKVDTEGSEGDILDGARHFQSHHEPNWLIEYHSMGLFDYICDWFLQHCGPERVLYHIPHPNTEVKGHGWVSTYGP